MTKLSAGKEVLSYCGKCKDKLAHMIITMKNDTTPGKTECKTCGAQHAYRANPPKPRAKRTTKKSTSVGDQWMEAIANAENKSKPYSIRTKFIAGDIIDHSKFGPGVVQSVITNEKIEVIFQSDVKTLVHNK